MKKFVGFFHVVTDQERRYIDMHSFHAESTTSLINGDHVCHRWSQVTLSYCDTKQSDLIGLFAGSSPN